MNCRGLALEESPTEASEAVESREKGGKGMEESGFERVEEEVEEVATANGAKVKGGEGAGERIGGHRWGDPRFAATLLRRLQRLRDVEMLDTKLLETRQKSDGGENGSKVPALPRRTRQCKSLEVAATSERSQTVAGLVLEREVQINEARGELRHPSTDPRV